MLKLKSEKQTWVKKIQGETPRKLAEEMSFFVKLLPDDTVVVDSEEKEVGRWFPDYIVGETLYPSLYFYKNGDTFIFYKGMIVETSLVFRNIF